MRVNRLAEKLRDILTVASVEGEEFTAQVVARVQGIPEREMLRALSQELGSRHRLVREAGGGQVGERFLSRYQFTHALFQEYLRHSLSAGERRLLHGEVGVALEALYGDHAPEVAVSLAHHYDAAGNIEKAIEYLLRAGDQVRMAYANEEAIAYFNRVLALLDDTPPDDSGKDRRLAALKGLGQVYYGLGNLAEAEEYLQKAIALGREIALAPRDLVHLYYWLGEVLWWQSRYDDTLRLGEEGLALLGDDTESVETVLMNQHIAASYAHKGNLQKYLEFTHRTAQFIRRLPYSRELRAAYAHIIDVSEIDRNVEEEMEWLRVLEEHGTSHHDLVALGLVHWYRAWVLTDSGDLHEGLGQLQQGLEIFNRVGDAKHGCWSLIKIANNYWALGDLLNAEAYAARGLETAEAMGFRHNIGWGSSVIGQVYLGQDEWKKAVAAFQKGVPIGRETGFYEGEAYGYYLLGQTYLARGYREKALRRFQEGLALMGPKGIDPHPLAFPFSLGGLEAAYNDPTAFRAYCCRFREEHPEVGDSLFVQWYLESAQIRTSDQSPITDEPFTELLSSDWGWQDQFGDCSFTVQYGLEIQAANGRNLWYINVSAPRILRPVEGDFVMQTACVSVSEEKPAIGGLVLWQDRENFLRLDRGAGGEHEIFFGGCLGNKDVIIGRGRLCSKRILLRLERSGDRVNALCGADGENWFTVGYVTFPVEDPLQVGMHAIGNIDRTIYHGAYPDGTAIRFVSFRLWEM